MRKKYKLMRLMRKKYKVKNIERKYFLNQDEKIYGKNSGAHTLTVLWQTL